jgi:hypothetical protein
MYLSTGTDYGILGFIDAVKNDVYHKLSPDHQQKLRQDLKQLATPHVINKRPFKNSYIIESRGLTRPLNIWSDLYFKCELFSIVNKGIQEFELQLNKTIFIKGENIYVCSFIEKNTFNQPILWDDAETAQIKNIYVNKNNPKIKHTERLQKCRIFFGVTLLKEEFQKLPKIPENLTLLEDYDKFSYIGNYVEENPSEEFSSKMSLINPSNYHIGTKTLEQCKILFKDVFNSDSKYDPKYIIVPV